MSEKTIFEKILEGSIPSDKVYEDEDVFAFRDIDPQAPVHVLVVPKVKTRSLATIKKMDNDSIARFIMGISTVATNLGLDKEGYRVVLNHGKYGQQSVEYIHAHILGGRQMSWPPG